MSRGFADMLTPYAARVTVVPTERDGTAPLDVDLTLHDSLAGLHLVPGPQASLAIPHGGRLVTYTWNPRPDLVELTLASGARGCLSKNLAAGNLVAALEAIHRGQVIVEYGTRPQPHQARAADAPDRLLTPREAEIITLITRGLDNFSIAREASLSINSVKSHIRAAYRKMGVSSRSQAVLWGVRNGYLTEEPASPLVALTG
ncbi:MAG: response regulator transcription factor [Nocardioides sp.]